MLSPIQVGVAVKPLWKGFDAALQSNPRVLRPSHCTAASAVSAAAAEVCAGDDDAAAAASAVAAADVADVAAAAVHGAAASLLRSNNKFILGAKFSGTLHGYSEV